MYLVEKRYHSDHSLFFLIILCLLICSGFSSFLIRENARIVDHITESFYQNLPILSNKNQISDNTKNNEIDYAEFNNGTVNEVLIRGKLQECIDKLVNNNKISQSEVNNILTSISNLYEIDNILNLKTEINLVDKNNENSVQEMKIKLDDFRYLEINNIDNKFVINKIFDLDNTKSRIEERNRLLGRSEDELNSINHNKKILNIKNNYIFVTKDIRIDQNLSLLKNVPVKTLIGYGKKDKTLKLITLMKKEKNGTNSIVYFSIGNSKKSLKYYLHSDGQYYLRDGKSLIQKPMFSAPISGKYRISSPFGLRTHPILRYKRMHNGVDMAATYGTPIRAASGGKIEFIGRKSGYGRYIVINHGGGYRTGYGHMSAFSGNLRPGSTVTRGQIIGKVGTSGLSSGPHLHYEVIKDKKFTNPLSVNTKVQDSMDRKSYRNFSSKTKEIDYIIQQLQADQLQQNHRSKMGIA